MNYEKEKAYITPNHSYYGCRIDRDEMDTETSYKIKKKGEIISIGYLRTGNIVKVNFRHRDTKTLYRVHGIYQSDKGNNDKIIFNVYLEPFDKRAKSLRIHHECRPKKSTSKQISYEMTTLRYYARDIPIDEFSKRKGDSSVNIKSSEGKVDEVNIVPDSEIISAYNSENIEEILHIAI
jgi:uncharacterized protein YuzE